MKQFLFASYAIKTKALSITYIQIMAGLTQFVPSVQLTHSEEKDKENNNETLINMK